MPTFGTQEDQTKQALETQKTNLEARLQGVGVDPANLDELDNRNIIQKALNLDEDQGLLMSTFDILNRPLQAVYSTVAGEGLLEGLTGESYRTGVELLDELGLVNKNDIGGVTSFAINMMMGAKLSPLTYTGGPLKLLQKSGLLSKKRHVVNRINEAAVKYKDLSVKASTDITKWTDLGDGTFEYVDEAGQKLKIVDKTVKDKLVQQFELDKLKRQTFKEKQQALADKGLTKAEIKAQLASEPKMPDGFDFEAEVTDYFNDNFNGVIDDLKDVLGPDAKNLIILKQPTSNNLADLELFYKFTDENGKEFFMQVSENTIEVKGMFQSFKSKAYASSFSFRKDNGVGQYEVNFAKGSKEMQDLKIAIEDRVLSGDATARKIRSYIEDIDTGTFKSKVLNQEEADYIADLIYQKAGMADSDWVGGVGPALANGKPILIRGSDFKALTTPSISIARDGKTAIKITGRYQWDENKIKNFIGKAEDTLSKEEIQDAFAEYLVENNGIFDYFDELMTEKSVAGLIPTVEKTPGKIIQWMDAAAASQNSFLNKPANFVKSTQKFLKEKFVANADVPYTFSASIARIMGGSKKTMTDMQAKILHYSKKLEKIDSNSALYVNRIAESGARLDAAGRVITTDKTINTMDVVRNFSKESDFVEGVGRVYHLGSFRTPQQMQAAEDVLNNTLQLNTNIDLGLKFKIIKDKNGLTLLKLEGGEFEDLQDAIGAAKNLILPQNGEKLNQGRMLLDQTTKDFYKQNQELLDEVVGLQRNYLSFLEQENITIPQEVADRMGYVRHTMTREAKNNLKEIRKASDPNYASAINPFRKRTYLGTNEEINSYMKSYRDLDFDLMETDFLISMDDLVRTSLSKMEQNQVLQTVLDNTNFDGQSLFQVVKNTPYDIENLNGQFKILKGDFKETFPKMFANLTPESQKMLNEFIQAQGGGSPDAVLAMHNAAFNVLKNVERAYMDLPDFIRGFDKFQNYWKSVTLISPGFHMRNFFGNMTNSYMAGMSFKDIMLGNTRAFSDIGKYNEIHEKVLVQGKDYLKSLSAAEQALYKKVDHFYRSGAAQTRRGFRDLENIKDDALKVIQAGDKATFTQNAKLRYNQLVKANFTVAERIDDTQRYSLYNWALENKTTDLISDLTAQSASGQTIQMAKEARAQEVVAEALFDYQKLTSFEKDYMKRLFPFYTFMKSNFAFQAKSLLKDPERLRRVGNAFDYWNEDIGGIATEDMPDYMQDRMWLALPMTVRKDDADAISFLKLNLTPSDFTELVRNPFKKGVTSLTAPLKIPLELGFGRDAFTGQPLERYPGEARRLEQGEGALPFIRDARGNLAVSSNPVVQKIMNDLGFRMPQNYLSVALDGLDRVLGYKQPGEFLPALSDRLSLTGTQTLDRIELTKLYQDLERMRNLQRYYAQEQGEPLPTLDEISRRQGTLPGLP